MLSVEVARRVEKWLTRLYGSLAYNVRYKLLNLHTVAVDAGSADTRAQAVSGTGKLSKRRVLTGRLLDRLSTSFRVGLGDSVSLLIEKRSRKPPRSIGKRCRFCNANLRLLSPSFMLLTL